jgi:hypothetical protein
MSQIRKIEDTDDTESDYACTICGTDLKQITDCTNSEEAKSLLLEDNETHLQAVSEFQIKVDIFCFSYNY